MSTWSRIVAACALVALAPAAASCTSAAKPAQQTTSTAAASSSSLVAKRWWSNSATQAGSLIDPKNPAAVAQLLRPSPIDYCGMLRDTVAAGHSILPNVTANDPALLTSTRAFVAELQAVAPATVAGPWHVLGPAVITIVGSGGDTTKVKGIDAAAVRTAASTVAADAMRSCGVDLSTRPKKER